MVETSQPRVRDIVWRRICGQLGQGISSRVAAHGGSRTRLGSQGEMSMGRGSPTLSDEM